MGPGEMNSVRGYRPRCWWEIYEIGGQSHLGIKDRPRGNDARGASGPTTREARGYKSHCWSKPYEIRGMRNLGVPERLRIKGTGAYWLQSALKAASPALLGECLAEDGTV